MKKRYHTLSEFDFTAPPSYFSSCLETLWITSKLEIIPCRRSSRWFFEALVREVTNLKGINTISMYIYFCIVYMRDPSLRLRKYKTFYSFISVHWKLLVNILNWFITILAITLNNIFKFLCNECNVLCIIAKRKMFERKHKLFEPT